MHTVVPLGGECLFVPEKSSQATALVQRADINQTQMFVPSMKNLEGLILNSSKRKYHSCDTTIEKVDLVLPSI